jgi:molecular chaperone Hsp33
MRSRKTTDPLHEPFTDFIQPFLIDHSAIRGRLVRLEGVLDTILKAHAYPTEVSLLLAEQIVLAALLSATLSDEGILTVQAKGDGPVRFIVVDVMAGGVMRGYAEVRKGAFATKGKSRAKKATLPEVMGKGYLAVTYDPGPKGQRYQGIVELKGDTLSEAFEGYFERSQQGEVKLHVSVRKPGRTHKHWAGGGMIIERMPLEGGTESEFTPEEQNDLWKRTGLFMRTLKDDEMLDSEVTPQNLLYRLFNEDGVWVYKLQPVKAGCRCSRERVETVLQSLPPEELRATLDDEGKLSIHCQFCNKRELFTRADIDRIYSAKGASKSKR